MRRILLGESPRRLAGVRTPAFFPFRMAGFAWGGSRRALTFVIKTTASFAGSGDRRACSWVEPRPFRLGKATPEPESEPARDPEAVEIDDLVPLKPLTDVLLHGHLTLDTGALERACTLRVGGAALDFVVTASGAGRVPIHPPYVRVSGSEAVVRGRATPSLEEVGPIDFDTFDLRVFQAAHERFRVEEIPLGEAIVLEGLVGRGERLELALPELLPRVLLDASAPGGSVAPLTLHLDTLLIDLDAEVLDLCFRAFVETSPRETLDVDRLIVGFASEREWEAEDRSLPILRELPRGRFSWLTLRSELLDAALPPPLEPHELELARHEALDQPVAPLPVLTLEEHARISAELLEGREPREAVLARSGLDEFSFLLEERAVADALGRADPDESAQSVWGQAFLEAEEDLAEPREAEVTPEQFADLAARVEVENPKVALGAEGLSVGAYMRIERRMTEQASSDLAFAEKLESLLASARERHGEPREPELDDDGEPVT